MDVQDLRLKPLQCSYNSNKQSDLFSPTASLHWSAPLLVAPLQGLLLCGVMAAMMQMCWIEKTKQNKTYEQTREVRK